MLDEPGMFRNWKETLRTLAAFALIVLVGGVFFVGLCMLWIRFVEP